MVFTISTSRLLKAVEFLLLFAILGLLLWSQPWNSSDSERRKITVTGESVIEATPDEYLFRPHFEATGTDQNAMKDQLTSEANETVNQLKELGVEEQDLKLDVSSFDNWFWRADEEGLLTAYIEIKIRDNDLAQKVQNYLLNTNAKGQLSPQATFSEAKKKELERQAIEQAIDDAKMKAELQAKKFNAKVGAVIEVTQSQDSIFPMSYDKSMTLEVGSSPERSLPVLPGQNEYRQSVTVTYELR